MTASPDTAQRELGTFIRSHRERLTPEMLGLQAGTRRRTPGLRREELAHLAGVSATWYTWIEQGRDVGISAGALMRLARVLRLTTAERAYLFELSGKRDPEAPSDPTRIVPEELAEIVRAITVPAYALDRTWTAVAWNPAAVRLFTGWLDGPDVNLLRYVFLNPAARLLIADWPARARRLVAEFRADFGRHLAAPDIQHVVEELEAASPDFVRAWRLHGVLEREGGERAFHHPRDGALRYQQTTLLLARHHDIKLVVLTPLGQVTHK
jgi:transcriptional regulator with XRE-family HTH domain